LEGKKWSRSVPATLAGSEAPGKSGNLCGGRPNANLFAVQRECEVAEDKKSDQCVFLAKAMALKYVLLELFLTTVTESPTYRLFTPTTLTLVTHNLSHTVL